MTIALGEIADVGIGYVTGANDYFHFTEEEAFEHGIPSEFLRPALRKTRLLTGLRLTKRDWEDQLANDEAEYLLHINGQGHIPDSVWDYIAQGERLGIPGGYKCRTRTPWYTVPHVYVPDAFLTYMSGPTPKLVVNEIGAVAPNTLHLVRLYEKDKVQVEELASSWITSLTRLSVEIEGHSLGGGMLKLEPAEAASCVIAKAPKSAKSVFDRLAAELDDMIKAGHRDEARALADKRILRDCLGLSRHDCEQLAQAAEILRRRRYER